MKKTAVFLWTLACILTLSACGQNHTYKIKVTIPAGSMDAFVWSEEEISPVGKRITVLCGEGLDDTEIMLKPVEVKEENAYEPAYLTPGLAVRMGVEKDAWFRVGVAERNETDTDRSVYVVVEGVEVRIA